MVDESEALIINRIFEEAAAGTRCPQIASNLSAEGIPSPRRTGWRGNFIHSLIKSATYYGEHEYGRTKTRKLNSERHRRAWAREFFERHG